MDKDKAKSSNKKEFGGGALQRRLAQTKFAQDGAFRKGQSTESLAKNHNVEQCDVKS